MRAGKADERQRQLEKELAEVKKREEEEGSTEDTQQKKAELEQTISRNKMERTRSSQVSISPKPLGNVRATSD